METLSLIIGRMVATLTRAKARTLKLIENVGERAPLTVDADKGVIYGVKILGATSQNNHGLREATKGTRYTPDAMRAALPLYEGMTVRIDHPERGEPGADRSVRDTFGTLRNVRIDGDSMRGDLHYLKSHPLAAAVTEDVTRGMGLYGLSHNAMGQGSVKDGVYVVEKIPSVLSVDLVDRPATNRNLWESNSMDTKQISLKSVLEAALPKLSVNRAKWAKRLLEDGAMGDPMGAMADATPEVAADPAAALDAGFKAAINAVLDDDSLDAAGKLTKIKQLLQAQEKLNAQDEPAAPTTEEAPADEPKKDDMKESTELKARLDKMERKDACRTLCESIAFTPNAKQLDALMELTSEPARRSVAESFKVAATNQQKPRSQGPTTSVTEGNYVTPTTSKEFARLLKGN